MLDQALKTTNRRVNALEYILIPRIQRTIDWIESELDEESREDFFRLKKVQDNKKKLKEKVLHEQGKHMLEQEVDEADEDVFGGNEVFEEAGEEDEDVFV